jgi:Tol biopolymer transport system component
MVTRLATLTAVLALLVAAAPASAGVAARNGAIAYYQSIGGPDADSPETRSLLIQRPGAKEPRVLVRCQLVADVPTGGDCTARQFSSPSWSPDGRTLVFDAGRQIGVVAAAGGPVRLLPAVSSDDGDPSFEAGGRLIVFTAANEHGSTDVYFRRVDGTDVARLLVHDASEPASSPRGSLAYVRSGNVYLQKPGGHRQWVTSGVSPDWAPNGRRLVLIRPRASLTFDLPVGRIFSVRGSGGGLARIGTEGYASHPVWSPDGRFIAYDGLDLGVYLKRVGKPSPARELAPTQFSGESGFVSSAFPAWGRLR